MTTATERKPRLDREQVGWGIFLMLLGVWLLLLVNDQLPEHAWRRWWPFALVALGVVGLFTAGSPKSVGSAVTNVGLGLWMAAAVQHWYGLGWSNSWPLALVAVGFGALAEWAASVWRMRRGGQEHVG